MLKIYSNLRIELWSAPVSVRCYLQFMHADAVSPFEDVTPEGLKHWFTEPNLFAPNSGAQLDQISLLSIDNPLR